MQIKSLKEVVAYVGEQFASRFYGGVSRLRYGVLKIFSDVVASMCYLLMLLILKVWKNIFISTCDVKSLEGFGAEYGIPHKPPMRAIGKIIVHLSDGYESATIPSETYFIDKVNNIEYMTTSSTTIDEDNDEVYVIATEPGQRYNSDEGVELDFRDDVPEGVEETVSVSYTGIYGGYEETVVVDGEEEKWGETSEEYRSRLLDRRRNPAHGGSLDDYRIWAERFAFVTNAYPKASANDVCVAVANRHVPSFTLNEKELSYVSDYVTSDSRRPITANVKVVNVTVIEIKFEVTIVPLNSDNKNKVNSVVEKMLSSMKPGESMSFDYAENTISKNVKFSARLERILKNSSSVNSISLSYDVARSIAEIPKGSVVFFNGEM